MELPHEKIYPSEAPEAPEVNDDIYQLHLSPELSCIMPGRQL